MDAYRYELGLSAARTILRFAEEDAERVAWLNRVLAERRCRHCEVRLRSNANGFFCVRHECVSSRKRDR